MKAEVSDPSSLSEEAIERIQCAIRSPVDCFGQQVTTDASIGIAIAPDDGSTLDQLLKNADLAMYDAKNAGRRTFRFFAPEMASRMRARRALECDLREAMTSGASKSIISRSPGPREQYRDRLRSPAALCISFRARRMVSPAEFIPLAEETGLITAA